MDFCCFKYLHLCIIQWSWSPDLAQNFGRGCFYNLRTLSPSVQQWLDSAHLSTYSYMSKEQMPYLFSIIFNKNTFSVL